MLLISLKEEVKRWGDGQGGLREDERQTTEREREREREKERDIIKT